MEEATREQQREARRQKVLARSQGDHRATVADLATSRKEMAPEGASAEQDEVDSSPVPGDDANAAGAAPAVSEDSNKSASRLAAERRRQRILSKSSERMAKVQGDRLVHAAARGGGGEGGDGGDAGGRESLDDVSDQRDNR